MKSNEMYYDVSTLFELYSCDCHNLHYLDKTMLRFWLMELNYSQTYSLHWWIFYKDSGAPPSGKKSTCWQKLSEYTWKLANFPSKIMFWPNFSYFFLIFLPKFPNFGIFTTIFPKIWMFSRNFTKNFFGRKCRGPWQNRDFLVKYSPVGCKEE